MAVQIAFVFQSPDRTDYLNQRLAGLIGKGIYSGAELTPTGSGLTATRAPFFALGRDGITIWDSEVGTFTYTSGIDSYHVLLAKYNPLGTPSTPVVQELVLSASEYNTHVDKPYLRDEVGPFGRAQLRGVVDNVGDLPTGDPNWNRSGDLYVCNDDPAPGGGGLYMYEDGTGWRLVAARGAATLDGAYDNNGAGGPPGYGRWIAVDSQAVELIQDTTSQRQNDVGNAALRIRKTGSTIAGDVGADVVVAEDKDVGGLLIRSKFTSGTYIEADEPVNVSGSTLTATRGGANWNHSSIHKIPLLVELTDSAISNDGLFVALPNGAGSCVIRSLDASTPTLSTETGTTLKANFFSIRQSIGAAGVSRLTEYETGSEFVGSTEFYGGASGSGTGKITYFTPGTLGYVWKYKMTQAGASGHTVAYMTDGGSWVFRPKSGSEDWHTIDTETNHPSFAAIRAEQLGSSGHAVRALAEDGVAVYGDSNNNIGVQALGGVHGLYASSDSATWYHAGVRVECYGGCPGVYATVNQTYAAVVGSSTGVGGKGGWFELNNAGDTTGYGLYCKHAGSGSSIFTEALGATGVGLWAEAMGSSYAMGAYGLVEGQDAIGVFGEHALGSYSGWGILGWSNNTDANKAAIDGFAWGNGPGVQGGSVFGKGMYGNSSILSLLPGVHGEGLGLGTGVKGSSVFGMGVEGGGPAGCYAYTDKATFVKRVPLTEMEPYNASEWRYQYGIVNGWDLVGGSGSRPLTWTWTDFPDGIRVTGITFTVDHPGTVGVSCVVAKRTITWDFEILVHYAYEYSSSSFAYALQTSGAAFGGSGVSTLVYGFGTPGTPFTAQNLEQPNYLGSTTASLSGSELMVYFALDLTGCTLLHMGLTCECRGASLLLNPTTL
jgi:hypothetical protein